MPPIARTMAPDPDPDPSHRPADPAPGTPAVTLDAQTLLDHLGIAVAVFDAQGRLQYGNADYRRLDGALADGPWHERLLAAEAGEALRLPLADGRWQRIAVSRLPDGRRLAVGTDITELVHQERQLAALSETDDLTQVGNRRLFDRRLAEEWARSARLGTPLAVLMVDVDHLDRYRAAQGDAAADDCLLQVAQRLQACVRRPLDVVARLGDDTFAIVLPHATPEVAARLARRCIQTIDEAKLAHAESPGATHLTLSVGHASAHPHQPDEQAGLLRAAEQALDRARALGRHRAERAIG
jgi:diguanylate cyclase (GGDEF)-like protein